MADNPVPSGPTLFEPLTSEVPKPSLTGIKDSSSFISTTPLKSRKEVIQFLKSVSTGGSITLPISQCDFFVVISATNLFLKNNGSLLSTAFPKPAVSNLIVTGFGVPNNGFTFPIQNEMWYYPVPAIQVSEFSLEFMVPISDDVSTFSMLSPVHTIYENQYTRNGMLRVISFLNRPVVTIYARKRQVSSVLSDIKGLFNRQSESTVPEEFIQLFMFTGCFFSCPTPTVSPASSEFARFTTTVTYTDFSHQ